MRRASMLAIVGTVIGAVTVVGLGTLALTRLDARHRDEDELAGRAAALAEVLAEVRPVRAGWSPGGSEASLGVDGSSSASLDEPPAWLRPGGAARLRAGETVTATDGGTVHAAGAGRRAAHPSRGRAVVLTDSIDSGPGAAGRWFVVAGAATALAGVAAGCGAGPLAGPAAGGHRGHRPDRRPATSTPGSPSPPGRRRRAGPPGRRHQRHGGVAPAVAAGRARLPAVGVPRPADAADLDPRLGRGAGRRGGARPPRRGRDDPARRPPGSTGWSATCWTWPASGPGRSRLDVGPVDLADVAAGTAEGCRPELEDLGLEVAVDVPPGRWWSTATPTGSPRWSPTCWTTPGATPPAWSGSVSRPAKGAPGTAVLAVDDDGPGIPAEDRARVFDRLHTSARRAARPGTGTGVGLAIVAELAAAMGGRAEATGRAGGGARLTVILPRSAARRSSGPPTAAGQRPGDDSAGQPEAVPPTLRLARRHPPRRECWGSRRQSAPYAPPPGGSVGPTYSADR